MDGRASTRVILVVGCPRSGTTLAGKAIGNLTGVLQLDEASVIYGLASYLRPELSTAPSDAFPSIVDDFERLFAEQVRTKARSSSSWAVVEHTPWNVTCADRFHDVFSDVRIVHMLRNGRDVCASLERSYLDGYKWAGETLDARIALWRKLVSAGMKLEKQYGALRVRFEDLTADPIRECGRICDYVGASFNDAMLGAFLTVHASGSDARQPAAIMTEDGIRFQQSDRAPKSWSGADAEALALVDRITASFNR